MDLQVLSSLSLYCTGGEVEGRGHMTMEALGLELQNPSPEPFSQVQAALAPGDTSPVYDFIYLLKYRDTFFSI